mgnify:CR=1 FL=1
MSDRWTEDGRFVNTSGQIVYEWPPKGRFKTLWEQVEAGFSDEEKHDVIALLRCWQDENSMLVSYTDEDGEWVNVEPNWSVPPGWLDPLGYDGTSEGSS